MKQSYRSLIKQKKFMALSTANIINRLGDSVDMIAFTWLVYEITHSPSWSAIILGCNMLPTVCIQPIAGAIVEKMGKRRIMIYADLIRGMLVSLIATLYIIDALNPWILFIITLLNSSVEAFRVPASLSFLPQVLDREYYDFGVSFSQTSSRIMEVIGSALGGFLIASAGIQAAIYFDAISFFLSAFFIFRIPLKEIRKPRVDLNLKSIATSFKEGLIYVKKSPIIIILCIASMFINVLLVPASALQAPYIKDILHQGAYLLSIISIFGSLGMGIGSFIYPFINHHFSHRTMFLAGGFLCALLYPGWYITAMMSEPWLMVSVLAGVMFISYMGIAFILTSVNITIISSIDQAYMARCGSIINALATSAMPVSSFLLSMMLPYISMLAIFIIMGLFTIIFFTVMMFIKVLKQM